MNKVIKEPAWLLAKVDQRLALMKQVLAPAERELTNYGVIMTPLTEPREGATAKEMAHWDNACDNCDRYVPDTIVTGSVIRRLFGLKVNITFGACPECMALP